MTRDRVLLVEDDDDARALVREALVAASYLVTGAKNGREALDRLIDDQEHEPALIVLDMEMPVMTGWAFLAVMKNYWRFARIPVIVVSGSEPHPDALASGAVAAWMTKPFAPRELASLISGYARRYR